MKASLAWITQLGSKDQKGDYAFTVATDPFGFVYIAGYTQGLLAGGKTESDQSPDAYLAKFDRNGNRLWVAQISSHDEQREEALGIATDSMGYVYVAGYTEGLLGEATSSINSVDAWVAKYDVHGNQLWLKQVGGKDGSWEKAMGIATDALGNVYLAGYTDGKLTTENQGNTGQDAWLAKFSTDGEREWLKQITSEGSFGDIAQAVATDAFGNIFVSGYTEGDMGEREDEDTSKDVWLAKFDTNGQQIWISQIGSVDNKEEEAQDIATDSFGNVYMAGYTAGHLGERSQPQDQSVDAWLAKFDKDGNEVWLKQIGSEDMKWDEALGVTTDPLGGIYIAGFTYGTMDDKIRRTDAGADAWLAKYDTDGVQQWIKQIRSEQAHWGEARAITCDAFGNIYLAGFTDDQYGGRPVDDSSLDAWLAKFEQQAESETELARYISATLGHMAENQYRLIDDIKQTIRHEFDLLKDKLK